MEQTEKRPSWSERVELILEGGGPMEGVLDVVDIRTETAACEVRRHDNKLLVQGRLNVYIYYRALGARQVRGQGVQVPFHAELAVPKGFSGPFAARVESVENDFSYDARLEHLAHSMQVQLLVWSDEVVEEAAEEPQVVEPEPLTAVVAPPPAREPEEEISAQAEASPAPPGEELATEAGALEAAVPEPPAPEPTVLEVAAPEPPAPEPTVLEAAAPEPPAPEPTVLEVAASEPPAPEPTVLEVAAPEPPPPESQTPTVTAVEAAPAAPEPPAAQTPAQPASQAEEPPKKEPIAPPEKPSAQNAPARPPVLGQAQGTLEVQRQPYTGPEPDWNRAVRPPKPKELREPEVIVWKPFPKTELPEL